MTWRAREPRAPLLASLGVMTAANVLNNRLAPRAYVPTSLAATAALVVIARRGGCGWDDLGLSPAGARRGLRWAAALAAPVAAGYAAAALLPGTRPLLADRRVAGLRWREVLDRALVRVPLGTVLLEEVAFRGVLYALLRRRYGTPAATAVSAGLFGLWHLLPAGALARANPRFAGRSAVPGVMVFTAAGGVVLCELRRRGGSLLVPIGLHAALNGFGYLASWAVIRRESREPRCRAPGTP